MRRNIRLLSPLLIALKSFFLFCVVSLFPIRYLHPAEEEIRVELTTRSPLSPIYLALIHAQDSSLKPTYLKQLRQILDFDLRYSGYASLLDPDESLEKGLRNPDLRAAFHPKLFQKGVARYLLKGIVNRQALDFYLWNGQTKSLKKFDSIPLTGEISKDRKQLHKLSDALLLALFNVQGIASHQLLYSVQLPDVDANWQAEIWQCDIDGENGKQVTYEQGYAITPTCLPIDAPRASPGNDRFLYVSYKTGQPKIYYSSLKSRSGKPLLDLRGNQLLPAVSKQRDKLAFISDASGRADLFVQAIAPHGALVGKPCQLFSYPQSTQASPTFNPAGDQIAFVSDKDGSPRIYVISCDVTNQKRPHPILITKQARENTCPSWSADGTKLAYSAKTQGVRQIWIYDFVTKEEKQLTTGPGNKENPSFAPDSLHLVFNSTDPGSSELYLINLNQPEAVKITKGPGKKHYPTWGIK